MALELTPEQDRFLSAAVESGRALSREQAVGAALGFWAEHEALESSLRAIQRLMRESGLDERHPELARVVAQAVRSFEREMNDDPFHTFEEWSGEADSRAYADL